MGKGKKQGLKMRASKFTGLLTTVGVIFKPNELYISCCAYLKPISTPAHIHIVHTETILVKLSNRSSFIWMFFHGDLDHGSL